MFKYALILEFEVVVQTILEFEAFKPYLSLRWVSRPWPVPLTDAVNVLR